MVILLVLESLSGLWHLESEAERAFIKKNWLQTLTAAAAGGGAGAGGVMVVPADSLDRCRQNYSDTQVLLD